MGEYLQAACTVNLGDLPLTITWHLNGNILSRRHPDFSITNSKRSSVLIIESVDAKHAGRYMCVGENRAGRTEYSADLIVNGVSDTPIFVESIYILFFQLYFSYTQFYALLGQRAMFYVIKWFVHITKTTFMSVFYLHLPVPPTIVPFGFGDEALNPGDAAQAHCLATKGDLPMDISWTFRSDTTDSRLQRDISTTPFGKRASLLSIGAVTANHQGDYTCIVQNKAGRAEYTASLVVNGTFQLLALCKRELTFQLVDL